MLESFLKKHCLIIEGYHGGQYIGPDCDKILSKLDDLKEEVQKQDPSKVVTPKLHIIIEQLPEFFEYTGKTLRKRTDQTVQASHSKFNKFVINHNYLVRDVESDKAGDHLLKAVKHFNSYNL